MNPESDTWRFLCSMPAIQWYKSHSQWDITHKVTGPNMVGCWRSKNSMADCSTTIPPIQSLIAGDSWPQRQLPSSIKDVSVASRSRKSLTLVKVVFIETWAIPELDGRSLCNQCSNPEFDCRRLFDSRPACNGGTL